ncbi:FAD binding domain of DNA photolyase [Leptospira yanagawae serovar Saopaulo str. Sao Paulo = ATCC 700523]|uniref:FAD binding domain of DNA photolyase n=1 Tax=Leptospira yanagawae serovar Saopaulo str. Sao Paulo = ATCC 700523 TaxID=1249483 RepID=A0A5E8HFE7_9LEPT|nr:FAD-binding domain-containing protein [Leptospira yanagawae]EOQ88716.1 FAD binding domain of DNA photolyase [Leptospira yanagawae serovar Saopaulo str. Sao Paulo = ATCC 700523]
MKVTFPTDLKSIEVRLHSVNPILYGSSRNYIDGAVSLLSPYIARGFISTKQVFDFVSNLGFKPYQITKFVQELTWRDYFQEVWRNKGDLLFQDLKHPQPNVLHRKTPKAILKSSLGTGIPGIDRELLDFYENGYLHNHVRMYIASIVCNFGGAYWKQPSQWMYYHLLDADLASNTCSWQWVSGSFSSKKYIANQENINRYLKTDDHNTFLDHSYEDLMNTKEIPKELLELSDFDLSLAFQSTKQWFYEKKKQFEDKKIETIFTDTYEGLGLDQNLPICIYDFYQLDPHWKKDLNCNRIFLMRPHFYQEFPSSPKTLEFIYELSKNIPSIKFLWGEWDTIFKYVKDQNPKIFFKEHPTNKEYVGFQEERDWIFPEAKGYFPSFFMYWKKCEKFWIRKGVPNQPTLFDHLL